MPESDYHGMYKGMDKQAHRNGGLEKTPNVLEKQFHGCRRLERPTSCEKHKGEEASVCSESASVSLLEMAVAALFQSMSSFQALGSIGMPVTSANSLVGTKSSILATTALMTKLPQR